MDHPTEIMLADYLAGGKKDRKCIETHLAACPECLEKAAVAYRSVKIFRPRKDKKMKRINFYLLFGALAFLLSFIVPKYFIQLLVATLVLGAKWVVDSKTTKMLVMIHEAWKSGGEKESSKILQRLERR